MTKGLWDSPLSSKKVAEAGISFEDLCTDSAHLFWTESRPLEKGRCSLVKWGKKEKEEDCLKSLNVKSRVHEYGGGAISCAHGKVYFANDTDKTLCVLDLATDSVVVLCSKKNLRYADIAIHPNGKFLYFVGEDHSDPADVLNALYFVNIEKKECVLVAKGHDFYASPQISKSGETIAFITWDFPFMSWDESSIWTAKILGDGLLSTPSKIAGTKDESVLLPLWSVTGALYYVSDRNGFWNLYQYHHGKEEILFEMQADFALPMWKLGRYSYAEVDYKGKVALVSSYTQQGIDRLGLVFPGEKRLEPLDVPFTSMTHLSAQDAEHVFFFGASPILARSVVSLNLLTKKYDLLKTSFSIGLDDAYISTPELISFPSSVQGKEAYAFYYPPRNPEVKHSLEKSPVIVRVHGGPTGHTPAVLTLETQFWTTRGFGYLDVNYGGSSGHGREYRDRLKKQWGVVDVKDCILATKELVKLQLADPAKLFIKGGSSGGLTALMALVYSDSFAAATSYYGVADLEMLAKDTHKFELHYLDSLIGPYREMKKIYEERSPVENIDKISAPVLLLQGKDDKVVPPEQSEKIYLKLKEKNMPTQLILFDEEGHGFRKSSTIEACLEAEWGFYKKFLKLL